MRQHHSMSYRSASYQASLPVTTIHRRFLLAGTLREQNHPFTFWKNIEVFAVIHRTSRVLLGVTASPMVTHSIPTAIEEARKRLPPTRGSTIPRTTPSSQ